MKYSKIIDEDTKEIIDFCDSKLLVKKLKNKTVLITGASGMIGSYFVYTILKLNELYDTNTKLKLFVRNPNKIDDYAKNNKNVEVIVGNVIEPIQIDGKVDYIIHAA